MINYHTNLVSALQNILPTHYELALTSKTNTPCISYMELTNVDTDTGNTIGYSRIQYQVKVWANDIRVIQEYSVQVDSTLRALGWRRVASAELFDTQSTMIQKILTFECLALENY